MDTINTIRQLENLRSAANHFLACVAVGEMNDQDSIRIEQYDQAIDKLRLDLRDELSMVCPHHAADDLLTESDLNPLPAGGPVAAAMWLASRAMVADEKTGDMVIGSREAWALANMLAEYVKVTEWAVRNL